MIKEKPKIKQDINSRNVKNYEVLKEENKKTTKELNPEVKQGKDLINKRKYVQDSFEFFYHNNTITEKKYKEVRSNKIIVKGKNPGTQDGEHIKK